ncbi:glutamate racemase [Ideonella sp.]|uniref:glutamate racemase n=1 Tax=Ideonella sp. TaxID=1929293 RepID=UPI0035B1C18A
MSSRPAGTPHVPPRTDTPVPPLIGIFDSGVGGLSVLRALHGRLPGARLLYVADSAFAPYGDRDPGYVLDRATRVADHLARQGARMVVVACNTATAWAIDALRVRHPELAWVGVEPGVKPAALGSPRGRIAVMATPATLASARYADLVARHAPSCEVHAVPCGGLAAAIERGPAGTDEVERLLDRYCLPLAAMDLDSVVLGCTHYPFVADRIRERLGPEVPLLDTADAIARRAAQLLPMAALAPGGATMGAPGAASLPGIELQSTGHPERLAAMARHGLGSDWPVAVVDL